MRDGIEADLFARHAGLDDPGCFRRGSQSRQRVCAGPDQRLRPEPGPSGLDHHICGCRSAQQGGAIRHDRGRRREQVQVAAQGREPAFVMERGQPIKRRRDQPVGPTLRLGQSGEVEHLLAGGNDCDWADLVDQGADVSGEVRRPMHRRRMAVHRDRGSGPARDPGRDAVGHMHLQPAGLEAAGDIESGGRASPGDQNPLNHRTSGRGGV